MEIRSPQTRDEIHQRNQLLQRSLRPDDLPFSIDEEYPLVLHPQFISNSFCLFEGKKLLAHANYQARFMVDSSGKTGAKLALIGNVATDAAARGRGLMRQFFSFLSEFAVKDHAAALILWSDLTQFYQKLGFRSLGRERLLTFQRSHLLKLQGASQLPPNQKVQIISAESFRPDLYQQIISLRPQRGPTLERDYLQFQRLLQIPYCDLIVIQDKEDILAFAILGKGFDMMGVIHEWGFRNVASFRHLLLAITEQIEIDSIRILGPCWETPSMQELQKLTANEQDVVEQSMCFVKFLDKNAPSQDIEDLFIWGLDSI